MYYICFIFAHIFKESDMDIVTIKKDNPRFPNAFKAIGCDCPEKIYAMGNIALLDSEDMVAIIGSRKASRAPDEQQRAARYHHPFCQKHPR